MNIAEKRFTDYPRYKSEIARRKGELLWRETDENSWIKQRGTNSEAVAVEVLKFENDTYIKNRVFWMSCVEDTLNELDDVQRELVKQRYFENVYGYSELGKIHNVSKATAWRICDHACKILAEKLGEEL
ncbi:phage transcriptional activator, RinA family [Granulicatella balaenopterae]|uniref:Phage transcriptional activator, RinA family n=1 Tax=Granulicatella balaenopterae TaxID=137733 RepID=A0A1H9IMX6_9LACT|nr:hypothetical protein [Granulicatella balaenopterae]SEQ75944.1 phage transcriptional activator, RinA family [Granulicatella balaenopterae]